MERALEYGWSLEQYRFGRTDPVRENDSDFSSQIGLVDDTLSAAYWLCYWRILKRVANILKEALEWTEGCACHDEVRHMICSGDRNGGLKGNGNSPLAGALKDIVRCRCGVVGAQSLRQKTFMLLL